MKALLFFLTLIGLATITIAQSHFHKPGHPPEVPEMTPTPPPSGFGGIIQGVNTQETRAFVVGKAQFEHRDGPADGNVLAVGGDLDQWGCDIANAVYAAELWSPQTQTWTTMASMVTPREYHQTAILLPDARVLVSGMGADFGQVPDEMNAEFYSPPYLSKGARPTITQAPSQVSYGSNFFVGTPDATSIAKAVLIRTGAVTHFLRSKHPICPCDIPTSDRQLDDYGSSQREFCASRLLYALSREQCRSSFSCAVRAIAMSTQFLRGFTCYCSSRTPVTSVSRLLASGF